MLVRWWALALAIAAAILLAPSLLEGTLISHSSPQNLTWAAQFADLFRAGILYPRWLPASFEGLGSPTFYFYPPIAFWVDAVLSVVTLDALSVSYRLSLSSLILLWLSGVTMHAWLKAEAASPRAAVYGALAYVAAPYHLLDHYYRGAYAEFAAYAVCRCWLWRSAGRRTAASGTGAAGAELLGTADVASADVAADLADDAADVRPLSRLATGLGEGRRRVRGALRLAGAFGLGLASIYLLPALTLQDWIPSDMFWGGYYARRAMVPAHAVAVARAARHDVDHRLGRRRLHHRRRRRAGRGVPHADFALAVGGGVLGRRLSGVRCAHRRGRAVVLAAPVRRQGAVPLAAHDRRGVRRDHDAVPDALADAIKDIVVRACRRDCRPRSRACPAGPGHRDAGSGIVGGRGGALELKQFLPARYPQKPYGSYAELSLGPVEGLPTIACAPAPACVAPSNGRSASSRSRSTLESRRS